MGTEEIYLKMGIEAKGKVIKRGVFNDFAWEIEVHHIGPDDVNSTTRLAFPTAEAAFLNMVSNFPNTVQHLIESYGE